MITPLSNESLNVFKSLFRGRQDVFAIRWERDGRNGYMPAYARTKKCFVFGISRFERFPQQNLFKVNRTKINKSSIGQGSDWSLSTFTR